MNKDNKLKLVVGLCVVGAVLVTTLLVVLSGRRLRQEKPVGEATQAGEIIVVGPLVDLTMTGSSGVGSTSSPFTVTVPFGVNGFRTGSFQFENMANASVTILASNDTLASSTDFYGFNGSRASSTRTFSDVTNDLIAAPSFASNRYIFLDTPIIAGWLRFVVTSSTSVTSTVRIKGVFSSQ